AARTPLTTPSVSLPEPPLAPRRPRVETIHGDERRDDYFWLRDKDDPEVGRYLDAENAYTAAAMRHTEAQQASLYEEMLGHIQQTDLSVPYKDGPWLYYARTERGLQYPIYCRKPAPDG